VVAALLVWWLKGALSVLFWGALIAYILSPLVALGRRLGLSRTASVIATFAALAAALGLLAWLIVPSLGREAAGIARQMPEWSHEASLLAARAHSWYEHLHLPPAVARGVENNLAAVERQVASFFGRAGDGLVKAVPAAVQVVLAPIVAAYLLIEAPRLRRGILVLFPLGFRPHLEELAWRLDRNLGGFLRGQILVATVVGLLAGLTVTLFGLGYGLMVGVIAGATDVIPYVGPVIGAIPALLLALVKTPGEVVWVALAFFVVHQLEGGMLSPALVGMEMGLKPLAVLLALFLGGEMAGVPGLLLAVPVAGALVVVARWAWNLFTLPPAYR